MANWLTRLAEYLRANNIDKTYVTQIPAGQNEAVLLVGPLEGVPVDEELPGYHTGVLQVVAQAKNPARAISLVNSVEAFLKMYDTVIDGMLVKKCHPINLPIDYPRADSDLFEASVDYFISFVEP